MQNTIVYLIGYAGTGKYTIAKELARLTGAVLVDNQLINSPVFCVIATDGKTPLPAGVWPKIESIRRIVLDTVAELAPPEASFLFTNELFEGKPMDHRWYEDVAILATKRQARLVPVILRCDPEELSRRVTSPERALRFKHRSADRTRENIRTHQLLQRTAQKAPFFHKTGMNGRSFRAGWDGDALGSRLVAEESVQGWRGFAVPAVKRKKERKARHSHVLE